MTKNCQARNDRGEPCRAHPLRDSDFCLLHDPEQADAVQEARRLGGRNRRTEVTVATIFDVEGLESVPQIRRLAEIAMGDLLRQEPSITRARTLLYLVQVALALHMKGEIEQRLEAIEAALAPRLRDKGPGRFGK
jgi:hypothetical protein